MSEQLMPAPHEDVLDVAIVGGGVSGLYTGWRLRTARPEWTVAVYELSNRIGGRLLTWLPYGPDAGLRAELGGMRFFKEQRLVYNLIHHFGLPKTPFFVSGSNLLWYLRGTRMPAGDADTAATRYSLDQGERGMSPGTLIAHFIYTVLTSPANRPVIDHHLGGKLPQTREDWDTIKPELTYDGRRLWDLGFWNILSDVLSYEGYQYAADGFGYYSVTSNWNAAEGMQSVYLDFTQNPAYETLVAGYGQLPDTLGRHFLEAGGEINYNQRLMRFDRTEGGEFLLQLQPQNRQSPSCEEYTVRARHVVLALPRASLTALQESSIFAPSCTPELNGLLNSVVGYPAFKFFLLYTHRWWEDPSILPNPINHGRSVCDLPLRQTYYMRPDVCEIPGSSECPDYGLLMVSYDDARAVDYWKGMEQPEEEKRRDRANLVQVVETLSSHGLAGAFSGLPRDSAANASFDPPPNLHRAPEAMIRRAHEQLALLHGLEPEAIPDPEVGAYADWSLEPWGGGWNFWQPQVDVKHVMETVKQPLGEDLKVYIVGEAYSGEQGWVEGALTCAEAVLQRKFDLSWPSWLPEGYYLGW